MKRVMVAPHSHLIVGAHCHDICMHPLACTFATLGKLRKRTVRCNKVWHRNEPEKEPPLLCQLEAVALAAAIIAHVSPYLSTSGPFWVQTDGGKE